MPNMDWYELLVKPYGTPPAEVFRIVWPILYILMGIGLYLAIKAAPKGQAGRIAAAFLVQIVLNLMWSPIFFVGQNISGALVVLVLLLCAIVWMLYEFYRYSKTAAFLNLPYVLWVSFAGYLNFALWQLN